MKSFSISYKNLVKELDAHTKGKDGATLIDGLIIEFGKFNAVDYLYGFANFVSGSTFRGCTYWIDSNADLNRVKAHISVMTAFKGLYPQLGRECNYFLDLANKWLARAI